MKKAAHGDIVTVHYIGTLDTGRIFQRTEDHEPLEFTIGAGQVFPALEREIIGMGEGETRNIVIAANMGYAFTTPEQMRDRVKRMHEHGIRICLMQGADIMLENLAKAVLADIRGVIG